MQSNIAARVRALLSKSTEAGCTEAEALAASAKARELLDKYQLTMTDVEVRAEGTSQFEVVVDGFDISHKLCVRVAQFCDCKVWAQGKKKIFMLGIKSDSEFANWLLESLTNFVQAKSLEYMLEGGEMRDVGSFVLGATNRINERLHSEVLSRKRLDEARVLAGQNSLVLSKRGMIDEEFAKLGFKLRTTHARVERAGNSDAFAAGRSAGDAASFARPVNGGGGVKAIR